MSRRARAWWWIFGSEVVATCGRGIVYLQVFRGTKTDGMLLLSLSSPLLSSRSYGISQVANRATKVREFKSSSVDEAACRWPKLPHCCVASQSNRDLPSAPHDLLSNFVLVDVQAHQLAIQRPTFLKNLCSHHAVQNLEKISTKPQRLESASNSRNARQGIPLQVPTRPLSGSRGCRRRSMMDTKLTPAFPL